MPDFWPNNRVIVFHPVFMEIATFISIGLQLGHSGSSNLRKIFSKLNLLAILSYHYAFSKKLKFLFLVNLHHFIEHYEARKDEEPICSAK